MTDTKTAVRNFFTEGRPLVERAIALREQIEAERERTLKRLSNGQRVSIVTPSVFDLVNLARVTNARLLTAWHNNDLADLWEELYDIDPGAYLHYFIRVRGLGDFKFGKTQNIMQRFRYIESGCSRGADLVACYAGWANHESDFKANFSHCRLNGEWFAPHPDLLEYLRQIGSSTEFSDKPAAPLAFRRMVSQ